MARTLKTILSDKLTIAEKLAELRAMKVERRYKFFSMCSDELKAELSEPCTGEAHDPQVGGMIDNCGLCMNSGAGWGRMLKRAPK